MRIRSTHRRNRGHSLFKSQPFSNRRRVFPKPRKLVLESLEERTLLFASFWPANHAAITSDALDFLHTDVLDDIADANEWTDVWNHGVADSEYHFCNTGFTQSIGTINGYYAQAVQDADPDSFDSDAVAEAFGVLLHIVQDFYAHSNWVCYPELRPTLGVGGVLVERGVGDWEFPPSYTSPTGTMFLQGPLEHGFSMQDINTTDPTLSNYLQVIIHDSSGSAFNGIVTCNYDDEAPLENEAPEGARISHDDLGFDKALQDPFFSYARELAVRQTEHEFERLCSMVDEAYPETGGSQMLKEQWVDPVRKSIHDGITWLRDQQIKDGADEGAWEYSGRVTEPNVGVTSMAVSAFLNHGIQESDPDVARAISWILSKQDSSTGMITDGDYETYDTALAIIALNSTGYSKYFEYWDEIYGAAQFLIHTQNDLDTGYSPANPYYGGWSYGPTRPNWADLSNSQFVLLALHYAEQINPFDRLVPADVWDKAETFIERCQNREASNPDFNFYNDGGFIYMPGGTNWADGRSYTSMTSAGLWGLKTAGVRGWDPRVQDAFSWLDENYQADQNSPIGSTLLYYSSYSVAKACVLWDVDTLGGEPWYDRMSEVLVDRQEPDGYWAGTHSSDEPDLVATCWAILAMETRSVAENTALAIRVDSPVDLHVYDAAGRHVGMNYLTGEVETEIPGATYSGPGTEPQLVWIDSPQPETYDVKLVGTGTGPFTLTIEGYHAGALVSTTIFAGAIQPEQVYSSEVIVSAMAGPITIDASGPSAPPEIVQVGVSPTVIDEGESVVLTGSFADPDLLDRHALVVDWGDGAVETILLAEGLRDFSVEHRLLDDKPSGTAVDDCTISVTVSDGIGSDTATTFVTVNNVAPVFSGTVVYCNDFDRSPTVAPGVTASLTPNGAAVGVGDFAGLGTGRNTFAGRFLRNDSPGNPAAKTTLMLANLPSHTSIDLNFLLAIIDSWDGETPLGGSAPPDYLNVEIDGSMILSETFDFLMESDQSYVPPAGVQLTPFPLSDLGFSSEWPDAAYNMGLDPNFDNIPHTSDTLTVSWYGSGAGWQGGYDESWAIENVEVILEGADGGPLIHDSTVINEGGTVTLAGSFFDPGKTDSHTVKISWGDGRPNTVMNFADGERSFSTTHQYLDDPGGTPDDYAITVTMTDDDGGGDFASTTVTVNNVAPVIVAGADQAVDEGTEMLFDLATFYDLGTLDTHTATIDWGDGTPAEAGTVVASTAPANVALDAEVTLHGASFFTGGLGGGLVVNSETIVDGAFLPRSTQWDQGAVWWDSRDGQARSLEIDLGGVFEIESFIVQADDNDAYTVYYRNLHNQQWEIAWDVPWVGGWGLQTRPNPDNDLDRYVLPSPIVTSALKFEGKLDDSDGLFSVSEIQAYGHPAGGAVFGSHVYADDGNYTVTVTVTDDDGGLDSATFGSVDVLVIYDVNNTHTQALKSALEAAGMTVSLSETSENGYNGNNPSPSGFDAVIHLNGTTYNADMPTAGQDALVSFVENGGAFLHGEWNAYEFLNGRMQHLRDLTLFDRTGGSAGSITFIDAPGMSGHPVLANVPSTFVVSAGQNVGSVHSFSVDPATVLMVDQSGNDAVAVREFGNGRVVGFHHAGNCDGYATLSDANIQQLYVDGITWAAQNVMGGLIVHNVPPAAAIDGAPESCPVGTAVDLSCVVSDPGTNDTFNYAWSVTKDGAAFASGTGADFSFTPDEASTYVVNLEVTDDDGGVGTDSKTFTVTSDGRNNLTAIDVQKGATQRSYVRYLDLIFENAGGIDDLITDGRVQLTRSELDGTGGSAVALGGVLSTVDNRLLFDFGEQGIGGNRNSNVGDGYYEIALDLDNNGSFETNRYFYRLFGDVNGDRTVDLLDAYDVLGAYGQIGSDLEEDANGDGVVNALDRIFALRSLGRSLGSGLYLDD